MSTATTQHSQIQDRYRAGDALSVAFELVATPALFAFFGWLIDGALGTAPLFTLVLGLFTAVYAGWRALRTYSEQMNRYNQQLPSHRFEAALANQQSPQAPPTCLVPENQAPVIQVADVPHSGDIK